MRPARLLACCSLIVAAGCAKVGVKAHAPIVHLDAGTNPNLDGGANTGGCTGGEVLCSGVCVDTTSDPAHCGACDNACAVGDGCQGGQCVASGTSCSPGQTSCNGVCTDVTSDPTNCGACANACASGQTCTAGACTGGATGCTGNQTACGGVCTDLASDPANCGACGNACATGQTCAAGACGGGMTGGTGTGGCADLINCLNNCTTMSCQQTCVGNTGAQGRMLALTLFTCLDGACPGKAGSGGVCDSTAKGYNQSACSQCLMLAQSQGGQCESQLAACNQDTGTGGGGNCGPNETSCSGICSDLTSDPLNCGACGASCQPGDSCVGGQCGGGLGGGTTGCNGLVACLNACQIGDTACEQGCIANSTQQAQSLFNDLLNCLEGACPSTNGGVCDNLSPGYDPNACDQCSSLAQGTGGACSNQVASCAQDLP